MANECVCGRVMERAEDVNERDMYTCVCTRTYEKQDGMWGLIVGESIVHPEYSFMCKFCGVRNTLEHEIYKGARLRCGSCDELGVYEKGLREEPKPEPKPEPGFRSHNHCICGKRIGRDHPRSKRGDIFSCNCGYHYRHGGSEWLLIEDKLNKCMCGEAIGHTHLIPKLGDIFECKCLRTYIHSGSEWGLLTKSPDPFYGGPLAVPHTPDLKKGIKEDEEKDRWDLLPRGTIVQVVKAFTFGIKGRSPGDWKDVDEARRRYYNSAKRHIEDWWNSDGIDNASGLPSLAHACCCLLILMWFDLQNQKEKDDV